MIKGFPNVLVNVVKICENCLLFYFSPKKWKPKANIQKLFKVRHKKVLLLTKLRNEDQFITIVNNQSKVTSIPKLLSKFWTPIEHV